MADEIAVIYQRYRRKKNTSEKNESTQKYRRNMNSLMRPNKPAPGLNTICYESLQESNEEVSCRVNNIMTAETYRDTKTRTTKRESVVFQKDARSFPDQEFLEILAKKRSSPEMNHTVREIKQNIKKRYSDAYFNPISPYRTNFIVNTVMLNPNTLPPEWQRVFKHPIMQAPLRIYRCQLSTAEESCCCSCNSDAMFEVMKGLYDCYKKKSCDNCNCVLCGHLAKEERKLATQRKSQVAIGVETTSMKSMRQENIKKAKAAGLLTDLTGKSADKKENIIRGLANLGLPLPEGKTPSNIELLEKVRKQLGLPPEPKNAAERAKHDKAAKLGLLQPLEGKSKADKEKILQGLQDLGIELPEGRTPSEKSIIAKIKGAPKTKSVKSKAVGITAPSSLKPQISVGATLSQKQRKARAQGFLTTLDGKSPEQKEKIIRGLAQSGLPLPDGKTESEKKLIEKVKNELKLTEPKGKLGSETALKAAATADKLAKAKAAGLLTPLDGKTPEQKEKILRGLAQAGIPLPEGKTASEKALIQKIKGGTKPAMSLKGISPAQQAKAKAAGLLTPLDGKTPEQKEKILRGLAQASIPLPEGKTASEKALIKKIKDETKPALSLKGIPPEKVAKAKAAGFLTTLDGKTPEQKEKILRGLAQNGIPLPEGKTPSEQKLIEKVRKDLGLPPGPTTDAEKKKHANALSAGLITPLEGKTPEQKEKILRGLFQAGIPLPEGKTASEKALIQKIKGETKPAISIKGISPSQQAKAKAAGLLTPLDGKTPAQREKILRGLAQAGIPLPEGKTASEKALIQKIKDETKPAISLKGLSPAQLAKAKAAGLLTPLDGKTPEQKEKILRGLAQAGIPLPDGKTAPEKVLIKKIKVETKPALSLKGIPPEKVAKAKAAGLLTTLDGKTPEQKEKILRGLVQNGIPLPEGKTPSEQKLIEKVRKDLGLPPGPTTDAEKKKYANALSAGLITPLEGKTPEQKEKILRGLFQAGIPLPEGKTASEKALIQKIKGETKPAISIKGISPSQQAKAKAAGLLTPLDGKTPAQKEKILRGLAQAAIPLPEGKTASEKALIQKIKDETKPALSLKGIAPEKVAKAKAAGFLTTLDGKTPEQKEKIIRGLAQTGIPLPEGKTPSEQKLIEKVRKDLGLPPGPTTAADKKKYASALAAGLITPLEGKTPEQKEKILRGLAQNGIPLPEGKTPSEQKLIEKVRKDLGLPPGPTTDADKKKYASALDAGLITPLEGKTPEQKEKILRGLAQNGIPLPEGKTPSEQKLIEKVRKDLGLPPGPTTDADKKKYASALAAGLITPLEGKTPEQKEKILRALAQNGIPLPEGKTPSEQKLIQKLRKDLGLPPGPTTDADKKKYASALAAGLITPLEGKTPEQKEKILRALAQNGIPLPEGKTPSEQKLIEKVRKDLGLPPGPTTDADKKKYASALAAGLITPLEGKTPEQKEKILRALAQNGIPLPEGKTPSEQKLIEKVRKDLGLPPGPTTDADKKKYASALAAGLITPLEGKTPEQKEKILRGLAQNGIPLPEGKTPSEQKLIENVRKDLGLPPGPTTDADKKKYASALAAGLITPLEGKTPEQKEKILRGLAQTGIPLPEGKTPSEQKLIENVRKDLGLPPGPTTDADKKKYANALAAGLITPLKGKTPEQKEKILQGIVEAGIPLPEGKTASEKALIQKIKGETKPAIPLKGISPSQMAKAKAAGLLTPLDGKTPEQKEKILRGLAQAGIPLPEGKTASEKALIQKIKGETKPAISLKGISPSQMAKAKAAGLLTPLDGKTPEQKEKILRGLAQAGIPLPEGKTASEKALIQKIKGETKPAISLKGISPSQMAKAKAAGLLTPLDGKTPEQKKKILRGLAQAGIPLPEGKTASEKALIQKIKGETKPAISLKGISPSQMAKAKAAGLLTPLDGKTPAQKEKILRGLAEAALPLPEGKTASEKALIQKIKGETKPALSLKGIPPEKVAKAKAAGFLTTLDGKTPEQKEKILRGLAQTGIPLPEGKTPSEQKLIEKVRKDLGLPPGPTTDADKKKYASALAAGLITPLEGKTPEQKEKILRGLAQNGIPLPEGKTPSEQKLIEKVRKDLGLPPGPTTDADKKKYASALAAGLITPLEGKTPQQKEKILRGLAQTGIPLPEGKTPSEQKLIEKVRKDLGLPPGPTTDAEKKKYVNGLSAGLITPLEGKTPEQKEKILRGLVEAGIPLPEGKTASEKALIQKIKGETKPAISLKGIPPSQLAKAKAAGLLTPLDGKTPEQKEKILRGLAQAGIPLPEGKTASEKALIKKTKDETKPAFSLKGIPPEKVAKAKAAGLLTTLDGKTPEQKEKILRGLAQTGIPLPEGKTPSEQKLIEKVRKDLGLPPGPTTDAEKQKYAKALATGLITPLKGKTPEQKEKILRDLFQAGIPMPDGKTASEKALIQKIKGETKPAISLKGIPPSQLAKAKAAGLLTPLDGKTPEQKEKILRGLAQAGIPLPEGKTASEKALIQKIKDETKPAISLKGLSPAQLAKAKAAGLLTPLDGKTPEQKEKILRGLAQAGIPLPEGKTASEKALIQKIKDETKPAISLKGLSPAQLAKAKAAGLLTPLDGKTSAQKEKILRGLAQAGIPLPEGKTPSEKALIQSIQAGAKPEMSLAGIPSEKIRKARAAGLLTPLAGKGPEQKEKILRNLALNGVPLPEGKTPSEKALINKVRMDLGLPPEPKTPAERELHKKALIAGVLTPLEGKTPEQKEAILRKMIGKGIPLPEGRTASEKAIINKIKGEVKSAASAAKSVSEKLRKAKEAGPVSPLDGKTSEQKKEILQAMADKGLPLPIGKTASDRALIDQIKSGQRPPLGSPALPPKERTALEQETAKVITEGKGPADECICDLLTPESERESELSAEKPVKTKSAGIPGLEGKTSKEKEKILKSLLKEPPGVTKSGGIPALEGKTSEEKERILKGLSKEPQRVITPLDGKTAEEKEKIIRRNAIAGLPLPEGKTPSEKALIDKIKDETGYVSLTPKSRSAAARLAKAKEAGLLPPLEGKTPEEKEKILRKAQEPGIITPLEGKTPEQKEIALRKMKDAGLELPEGRTSSEKALINKIKASKLAAGIFTPLDGKSPAQKEKILKRMLAAKVPIPEGRTPSEKEIIKKVLAEAPEKTTPTGETKPADLLMSLKGKSPEEKENILRGQIQAGLPLPDNMTSSDKAIAKKVQDEDVKTKKDKLAGLSLTGKTKSAKSKILRELAEAGLPMPEGGTPSEKEMVKKARLAAGLPEVVTASEAKKFKDKKTGPKSIKKAMAARLGGAAAAAAGIQEEIQEIVKTDKCDAACGCDKKKIRFKHSYVKIRVTSPDISSFCPCPNECIPGVKAGVFTDNEGIKVTVGSVLCISSRNKQPTTAKTLQQSLMSTGNLPESQSLLLVKISSMAGDGSSVGLSSKSTVYIYNSESDVSISEIKRALRLNISNVFFEEYFEDDTERKKSLSFIYRSRFASNRKNVPGGYKRPHKPLINPRKPFLLIETEPCLSLSRESVCEINSLDILSSIARRLEYSSDSSVSQKSMYDDTDMYEPFYEETDLRPATTLLRSSKSYVMKPARNGGSRTELEDLYRLSEAKLTPRCHKPEPHYGRSIIELNQDTPSSRALSKSSVLIVVSTSAYDEGSSGHQLSDNSLQFLWRPTARAGEA